MDESIATIRELRTDFRAVKRKIERYGKVVITDRGEPAYILQPMPARTPAVAAPLDYLARLLQRQPQPLSAADTRRLWDEERDDR
ncbi:MAG: hypothetical protein Q7T30_03120 [Planctomycetota bacterium]|nr:hypothetical protein [Planctomycetota bacterium]